MNDHLLQILNSIPQQKSRQDSTLEQLRDLRVFANRLGLYDAANRLRNIIESANRKIGALQ